MYAVEEELAAAVVTVVPSSDVRVTDTGTEGDEAQPNIVKGSECWNTWLEPKMVETKPGASKATAEAGRKRRVVIRRIMGCVFVWALFVRALLSTSMMPDWHGGRRHASLLKVIVMAGDIF